MTTDLVSSAPTFVQPTIMCTEWSKDIRKPGRQKMTNLFTKTSDAKNDKPIYENCASKISVLKNQGWDEQGQGFSGLSMS